MRKSFGRLVGVVGELEIDRFGFGGVARLHFLMQRNGGSIVEKVLDLGGIFLQIEEFRPLVVAGMFDQLGGVGADGGDGGDAGVAALEEILVKEGGPPVGSGLAFE